MKLGFGSVLNLVVTLMVSIGMLLYSKKLNEQDGYKMDLKLFGSTALVVSGAILILVILFLTSFTSADPAYFFSTFEVIVLLIFCPIIKFKKSAYEIFFQHYQSFFFQNSTIYPLHV